jgi:hypothetical protein
MGLFLGATPVKLDTPKQRIDSRHRHRSLAANHCTLDRGCCLRGDGHSAIRCPGEPLRGFRGGNYLETAFNASTLAATT